MLSLRVMEGGDALGEGRKAVRRRLKGMRQEPCYVKERMTDGVLVPQDQKMEGRAC
ncbi:hypothetical protein Emed_007538 [Eimeria media]